MSYLVKKQAVKTSTPKVAKVTKVKRDPVDHRSYREFEKDIIKGEFYRITGLPDGELVLECTSVPYKEANKESYYENKYRVIDGVTGNIGAEDVIKKASKYSIPTRRDTLEVLTSKTPAHNPKIDYRDPISMRMMYDNCTYTNMSFSLRANYSDNYWMEATADRIYKFNVVMSSSELIPVGSKLQLRFLVNTLRIFFKNENTTQYTWDGREYTTYQSLLFPKLSYTSEIKTNKHNIGYSSYGGQQGYEPVLACEFVKNCIEKL